MNQDRIINRELKKLYSLSYVQEFYNDYLELIFELKMSPATIERAYKGWFMYELGRKVGIQATINVINELEGKHNE